MRELGDAGTELHAAVGRGVVNAHVNLLVTVGGLALGIAAEATRFAAGNAAAPPVHHHCEDSKEAASLIRSLLVPEDCVLVKGSRAMEMESIVAVLTGEEGTGRHG